MIISQSESRDDFILRCFIDDYDEKREKFKQVDLCIWRIEHYLFILSNSMRKGLHFINGDLIRDSMKRIIIRNQLMKLTKKKTKNASVIIIDLKECYDREFKIIKETS